MSIKAQVLNDITTILSERTDPLLIKTREQGSGRNKVTLSYVTGPVVIDKLNKAFNYLWDLDMVECHLQDSSPKPEKKWDDGAKKYVATGKMEEQNPVAHVKIRITAYIPTAEGGFIPIHKEAYGCQSVIGGQSEQENIFKGAATDALKKAAQNFGIALDLARSEEAQEYFDQASYVDPWTPEEIKNHQEEMDYIKAVADGNGLTDENIDQYVISFSEGVYQSYGSLTPEIFTEFYTWLKAMVDGESKGAVE